MGQQATLGPHQGIRPVQLRGKVRVADGNERVHRHEQQDYVGNFEMEPLDESFMQ